MIPDGDELQNDQNIGIIFIDVELDFYCVKERLCLYLAK